MSAGYYCDVERKARFTAPTLEEIAAYLSGCFCHDPLKLWEWRNQGEVGVYRCGYGFISADVGKLIEGRPVQEGERVYGTCCDSCGEPQPFGVKGTGLERVDPVDDGETDRPEGYWLLCDKCRLLNQGVHQ